MKALRNSVRAIKKHELRPALPLLADHVESLSAQFGLLLASRSISTRPRPSKMADYNKWTKDDLIKRVKELENELKGHNKSVTQPAENPPVTSEPPSATQNQDGDAGTTSIEGQPAPKKQKKSKSIDPSRYHTRFIALKLAYLGKNYNGFEYQSSGVLSTIEEELWKALVKACLIFPDPSKPNEVDWNVCEYSKCGRTDRGVSAFGQVVALRVRSNKVAKRRVVQQQQQPVSGENIDGTTTVAQAHQDGREAVATNGTTSVPQGQTQTQAEAEEEEQDDDDTPLPVEQEMQYARVLNRILPPDIRVYAWCATPPPDFSARFSCRERQYRYFFTQPAFAPLPNFLDGADTTTTSSGRPKEGWLDIEAMRRAAKLFEGLHDFRNFCKVDPSKQITNFVRRIYEADVVEVTDGVDSSLSHLAGQQFRDPRVAAAAGGEGERYPKVYYFHVRGSAFLWHQIRCMVSVLFLVGQGLEPPSVVAELLDAERNPRRPNYVLADDAPLVLWDCVFGRGEGGEAGGGEAALGDVASAADAAEDVLDWTYVGADADGPLNLHGGTGLMGDLWSYWRERKMDEILANRLLDWVARKTDVHRVPAASTQGAPGGQRGAQKSTRVFEGGNGPKLAGTYVPVLKKTRIQSPEEQNDRWAQRKGFKNAEEMRARGNWREVIRAAKEAGEAVEQTDNAT